MGPYASKGGKIDADPRCPIKKLIKWALIHASTGCLNFFQISDMAHFLTPGITVNCLFWNVGQLSKNVFRNSMPKCIKLTSFPKDCFGKVLKLTSGKTDASFKSRMPVIHLKWNGALRIKIEHGKLSFFNKFKMAVKLLYESRITTTCC